MSAYPLSRRPHESRTAPVSTGAHTSGEVIILLSKFRNPLLILLVAAALVSGVLGSRFEAGVILAIVFGSALIDFTNTYRSAKAAEALREKVTVTAAVLRDGKLEERHVHEIVPGDVFALEAGDIVPADGIVFEAKDLFVDESMLTGESVPVEKEAVAGDARTGLYGIERRFRKRIHGRDGDRCEDPRWRHRR